MEELYGESTRKPREYSSIVSGIFIFFMVTSGINCISKLLTNLVVGNIVLGIIMFVCEVANIYFLYAILQKKGWGIWALLGMLLLQIPLNLIIGCPDMESVYLSTFIRIAVFSLILLIPKKGVMAWSVLLSKGE